MANQHYFYNAMRKTIIQFLDIFNDIVIARYNQDTGAVIKYVKVSDFGSSTSTNFVPIAVNLHPKYSPFFITNSTFDGM